MEKFINISQQSIRIEIFLNLVEFWNLHQFEYGVAHGLENFPKRIGRDVDVLVSNDNIEKMLTVTENFLKNQGWIVKTIKKPWAYWIHIFKNINGEMIGFEIDLFSRMSWGSLMLVIGPCLISYKDNIPLSVWGGFVKRVFIQILGGNFNRFVDRPEELTIYTYEFDVVKTKLQGILGKELADSFTLHIQEKDIERLWGLQKKMCFKVLSKGLRQVTRLPIVVKDWLLKQYSLRFFPRKTAPIISFIGPDGVGKSTVIDKFREHLKEQHAFAGVIVKHWRPGLLPSLATLIGKKHQTSDGISLPRRKAGGFYWFRYLYYLIDFLIGYYMVDLRFSTTMQVVLYDRHAVDMEVDPVRFGLSSNKGLALFRKVIPKPDITFLLSAPSELIFQRKQELEIKEIERQNKLYYEMLNALPSGHFLDASMEVDNIVISVEEIFFKFYLNNNLNN